MSFVSPGPWSVVDLGSTIPYRLSGNCRSASVRVNAAFAGRAVHGPSVSGCSGIVRVPTPAAIARAGWAEGSSLSLSLVAGRTVLPFRHKRLEPDLGKVLSGNPVAVPSEDQQGDLNSLVMGVGDAVDLGVTDLKGIYGLAMRAEGFFTFELRAGSTAGNVIATDTGGRARVDWVIRPRSGSERYELTTSQLRRTRVGSPVSLILSVTAGAGVINFIDLTGSGVMAPYRFPTPLPKAIPLFNGKNLKGWTQMGPGSFKVDADHTLRSNPPPPGQWGWFYYNKRTFKNFVLRLEFKEESWGANSGVLIRHAATGEQNQSAFTAEEIQITDVNTEYTGGIDHVQTAVRQPQSSPGDWSTMEIVTNGPSILVRVNGVITSRYNGAGGCGLFALPCAGGEYGGYVAGGNGYIALEAEVAHVWFRNVEIHDCGVAISPPASALAQSNDPLCAEAS
jgi:3-keto-disaccharide hydrolase